MVEPLLPPTPPEDRMQRVRVGITGLAAVGIVVAVATAIASGLPRTAENITAPVAVGTTTNTVDPDAEPLAQLGAAPGGMTDKVPAKPK